MTCFAAASSQSLTVFSWLWSSNCKMSMPFQILVRLFKLHSKWGHVPHLISCYLHEHGVKSTWTWWLVTFLHVLQSELDIDRIHAHVAQAPYPAFHVPNPIHPKQQICHCIPCNKCGGGIWYRPLAWMASYAQHVIQELNDDDDTTRRANLVLLPAPRQRLITTSCQCRWVAGNLADERRTNGRVSAGMAATGCYCKTSEQTRQTEGWQLQQSQAHRIRSASNKYRIVLPHYRVQRRSNTSADRLDARASYSQSYTRLDIKEHLQKIIGL